MAELAFDIQSLRFDINTLQNENKVEHTNPVHMETVVPETPIVPDQSMEEIESPPITDNPSQEDPLEYHTDPRVTELVNLTIPSINRDIDNLWADHTILSTAMEKKCT